VVACALVPREALVPRRGGAAGCGWPGGESKVRARVGRWATEGPRGCDLLQRGTRREERGESAENSFKKVKLPVSRRLAGMQGWFLGPLRDHSLSSLFLALPSCRIGLHSRQAEQLAIPALP